MMPNRRQVLAVGGGGVVALIGPAFVLAGPLEEFRMQGTSRGEHVWFAPVGLAVAAGTTLRLVNLDPGNSHTSTCYHPTLFDRPQRIPTGAAPWDSDFLLPGDSFEVLLTVPGVYDFYCLPHEHAGMVGRIVVGRPGDEGWQGAATEASDLPAVALDGFPSVEAILQTGQVMPPGQP